MMFVFCFCGGLFFGFVLVLLDIFRRERESGVLYVSPFTLFVAFLFFCFFFSASHVHVSTIFPHIYKSVSSFSSLALFFLRQSLLDNALPNVYFSILLSIFIVKIPFFCHNLC